MTFEAFKTNAQAYNGMRKKVTTWAPKMFRTEQVVPNLSFEMLSIAGAENQLQSKRKKMI